jgi:hypothetical protein
MLQDPETRQRLCDKVSDKLVVEVIETRQRNEEQLLNEGQEQFRTQRLQISHDKDIQPMSDHLAECKQKRFEELLRHEEGRGDDQKIDREL